MRKHGRIDINQPEIVKFIRDMGHSVELLSAIGGGCPDILIGIAGAKDGRINLLAEIKQDKNELNDDQIDWHFKWRGQVAVIRSKEDAINLINEAIRKQGGGSK